jgi:hypothetical protein
LAQATVERTETMRRELLTFCLSLGLAATPALAQVDPNTGARPGRDPGVGQSWPLSSNASNTGAGDVRSTIAPTLPAPDVGENATPQQLLVAARQSLAAGRTGQAQEALERAQTRLLDRDTPLFQTNVPSNHPAVQQISTALRALGAGDRATAMRAIDAALPIAN